MTEAGDPLQGPDGVLTREARIHQARFLSRAFPQALAAGVDRHFWFVFPFLREGNGGWGLFEPQQRAPYPGLAALAAATYALGRGDCLGTLSLEDKDGRAIAFARGDDTAAVAVWRESDEPAEVVLPFDWEDVRDVRTHLGTPIPAGEGPVHVRAARGAVYSAAPRGSTRRETHTARQVADRGARLRKRSVRTRTRRCARSSFACVCCKLRRTRRSMRIVYRPVQQQSCRRKSTTLGQRRFRVICSCRRRLAGSWSPISASVSVAPGERAVVPVQLAVPQQNDPAAIRLVARSAAGQSTPAVVRLCADVSSLTPKQSLPLNLDDPARWQKSIAGHGTMEIVAGADGGVRLSFKFSTNGDNWAYPRVTFAPELDLSTYDGLRFEYRTDTADPGPVRVFLFEPTGAGYIADTGVPGSTQWCTATVLFSQLGYVPATPADPNGKLDTDRVAGLSVGAHSKPLSLVLEVRNIQAVKF